jgi:hypothetical protein
VGSGRGDDERPQRGGGHEDRPPAATPEAVHRRGVGRGGGTTALRDLRSGLAVRRDILGLGMIDQNHRRLHS